MHRDKASAATALCITLVCIMSRSWLGPELGPVLSNFHGLGMHLGPDSTHLRTYNNVVKEMSALLISPAFDTQDNVFRRPCNKNRAMDSTAKSGLFKDNRHVLESEDKVAHIDEAFEVEFPLQRDRIGDPLPDSIHDAIRTILDPNIHISTWRQDRQRTMKEMARRLAPINSIITKLPGKAPNSHKLPNNYNFALIAAMTEAVGWPDKELPAQMFHGFKTAGFIQDSHVFSTIDAQDATEFMHTFKDTMNPTACSDWLHTLSSSLKRKGHRAQAEDGKEWKTLLEVDKKSKEECDKKLCSQPMSYAQVLKRFGDGQSPHIKVARRFGIWQGVDRDKIRVIDDYKECGVNDATRTVETITLPNPEFAGRVAAIFKDVCANELQVPMPALTVAFDDLKSAYRLIPVNGGQCTVIAYFSPSANKVEYRELYGHAFGLKSAVLNFNRVPAMYMAFMHRFFAVVVTNYVDDLFSIDTATAGCSGQACIQTLCALTGSTLEAAKSKPPRQKNTGLGVEFDMTPARDGYITLSPTAKRVKKIIASLEDWRDSPDQEISTGEVQTINGKLGFVMQAINKKAGRGATQPLFIAAQSPDNTVRWNENLTEMLEFLKVLLHLDHLPSRRLDIRPRSECQGHVIIYTDASGKGGLGLTLYDTADHTKQLYASAHIPRWFDDSLPTHQLSRINQYETFAVLAALLTFEEHIQDRQVFFFVDNTTAIGNIVNGYSSNPSAAQLVNAICLVTVRANACIFYEYLDSDANVADLPSRLRPGNEIHDPKKRKRKQREWDNKYEHQWQTCFYDYDATRVQDVVIPTKAQLDTPALLLRSYTT